MVTKTVVTLILLANLKIRDLLNILLKGSFCVLRELICVITGIHFPLEVHSSPTIVQVSYPPTHSCPVSRKRKRVSNVKQRDDDHNGSENPKHRRNSKYHPNKDTCSPCALLSQSGSDSRLRHFHPIENSRHAGTEALALSQYAMFDSVQFSLRSSDCICQPCYKDFMRNRNNSENVIPRWVKVKNEISQQLHKNKHCIFCCGSVCECERVTQ